MEKADWSCGVGVCWEFAGSCALEARDCGLNGLLATVMTQDSAGVKSRPGLNGGCIAQMGRSEVGLLGRVKGV